VISGSLENILKVIDVAHSQLHCYLACTGRLIASEWFSQLIKAVTSLIQNKLTGFEIILVKVKMHIN